MTTSTQVFRADYNWEYGYMRTIFWDGKECIVYYRQGTEYDFACFREFPSQEELDASAEAVREYCERDKP